MGEKHVIKGWVGKNTSVKKLTWWGNSTWNGFRDYAFLLCEHIYRLKGKKDSYEKEDWPPKKIRITIEEIE